jgi:DNA replication protein DnaC
MSTPQLERLREHCHQLRLYQVENELTARLEQAAKKEISYAEFLDELLALELGSKAQKHHQMRIDGTRISASRESPTATAKPVSRSTSGCRLMNAS